MKHIILKAIAFVAMIQTFSHTACARNSKQLNRLNWVECSQSNLSSQIMFDFTHAITVEKRVDKEKRQLQFFFTGINPQTFNAQQVLPKLIKLKEIGLVKNMEITAQKNDASSIMFAIEFEERDLGNNKKNKLIIKWSVLEKSYRLIIDIFRKTDLEKLQKNAVLLHARNNITQYDVMPVSDKKVVQAAHKKKRIVIDAGHGGDDTGAKAWGLTEKDLTLALATLVYKSLKSRGYRAFLTRSTDTNISLNQRAQLAHQLHADLFVSIHVNSSGIIGSNASGLETFYLDGRELLPTHNKTGFLFINNKKNPQLVERIGEHLSKTLDASKSLATHIQNHVLSKLHQHKIDIVNRGTKPEKFRNFLQTGIPCALVEVGFITNWAEANRLAQPLHRKILAQGIVDGICTNLGAK